MKLIKVVKLQRVRYGDLDEGDGFKFANSTVFATGRNEKGRPGYKWDDPSTQTKALDTDKYPPEEITYTIEGIPEHSVRIGSKGATFKGRFPDGATWFDESEIETRYI